MAAAAAAVAGYHTAAPTTRYPVLYMHDGQNAVNPLTSFTGVDWGLDEALLAGLQAGQLQEFIAVLVWNTPQRLQEYMPAGVLSNKQLCIKLVVSCVFLQAGMYCRDSVDHATTPAGVHACRCGRCTVALAAMYCTLFCSLGQPHLHSFPHSTNADTVPSGALTALQLRPPAAAAAAGNASAFLLLPA
jgi:hypothetical protein